MKLKKIGIEYTPAWPIFELIPKPIYVDEKGKRYVLDVYYPKDKLTEKQQLELILRINQLPEELIVKVESEYEKVIILKDKKGNRYKFKKLPW